MSVSAFDAPLYRHLFGDDDVTRLFSDTADLRAMMLVLGALAKVQGEAGVIPELSGAFLYRAAMEVQLDPAGLATATGINGVTVPGLVAAMRTALEAPEHAAYLHWGATSQDIQDSALMLRLRQACALIEARLDEGLVGLADLAEAEAETRMAARTYGQIAVPSSFGALVAAWGWPLLRARDRVQGLRAEGFALSLSGAAGTASMLGPEPDGLRDGMARLLGLRNPGRSWHTDRSFVIEIAQALVAVTAAAGKLGEDLLLLTRSDAEGADVVLAGGGGSSTMPHKQNPVAPSLLVALSRFAAAQVAPLSALSPREARDGAAWFTEWLCLPPLVAATARTASLVKDLSANVSPNRAALANRGEDPLGLIHAEALSFALAAEMGRPAAQAEVKRLSGEARASGTPLPDLLRRAHPDLTLPDPADMGQAPVEALRFARAVRGR